MAISSAQDIVQPRDTAIPQSAIDALTDSFRKGQITVADIMARKNERDKAKIELQTLQQAQSEFADPAAIAARQSQTQLAGATAQAGLGLVQPKADAEKRAIENAAAVEKYPAIVVFDKIAPTLGIAVPMTADNRVDYVKKAQIGAQLAQWSTDRILASEELKNIDARFDEAGRVISSVTKQGLPVDPTHVQKIMARSQKPFQSIAPGTAETQSAAPATAAPATAAPATAAPATAAPAEGVAPSGTLIPGVGFSMGPRIDDATKLKAPTEAQQRAQLALSRFAQSNNMVQALRDSGYDPTSIGSWINSMLPEIVKSGDRKSFDAAVDAWAQGILRLESGAAISPKEHSWYARSLFPQVNDPPLVVSQKETMRSGLERMVAEMAQAGGVISPESAAQTKSIYAQAEQLAGAPSTGQVVDVVSMEDLQKLPRGSRPRFPDGSVGDPKK